MKRNILILISNFLKSPCTMRSAFFLLLLLTISSATRAQVVYTMGETASSSPVASDVVNRMNYNGTGGTTITTGPASGLIQPGNIALDGNNNRIFVSDLYTPGNVIKVINATTGAVIRTINSSNSLYIRDIFYDVANDWLYYITEGGSITVNDGGDGVFRVHADGTGSQTIATSITKNPYRIDVDAAGNKVYVLQVSFSGRALKTIDLANSNAITSRSFAASAPSVYDFAVDKVNGYIYYLTENSSATTLNATDALRRQNIDGTNDVALVTSIANTPFRLALDLGNNRAYVSDAYNVTAKIIAVNLTNNTFSTTLNLPQGGTAAQHADIAVPEQPKVTTTAASSITASGATMAGTLLYGYGLSTERGVVYSTTNATPTVSDSKAIMATATTNGAYSASVTGLSASATYSARAYASNGAGTTYGAVVTFSTLSNDATLSGFTISSGTLSPAFATATTAYTASVTSATTSITVTPTKNNTNASIKVNTTTVASGSASGSISLNTGANTITTVVTAQDGTLKTYTLTATRDKAAQTITFASTASKTFGNADFAAGASASSGLTVSYTSSNTAVATVSGSTIHIVGAGSTTITASQAGDANTLAATIATQTLTINKASQTITFNVLAAKIYGNADFAPGGTAASGGMVIYASSNAAVATIISNQVHILEQGTTNITASQAGTANYNAATDVVQSLTVNKATVAVTAAAITKVYGNADPVFTYTATGVVGSDAPTGVLNRATPSTSRFVGNYAINQGTLSYGNNYNITYVGANLTITKRPLTLHPIDQTKVYGDPEPNYTYQLMGTSYPPEDGMTGTYIRTDGEQVGTHVIPIGTKRPIDISANTGESVASNYNITFIPGVLTITAKPITVTASAQTKTYGDADPSLTYYDSGLAFSDSYTGALTRAAGEGFGTYAISKGTLSLNSNYILTFNGSNLTINKKFVNVTATAQTKTYGQADPALIYNANALATGDSFTGSITRAPGENFGTYAINQGTLGLTNNYTLNYTGANLNINKKAINVTATAQNKTYGDSDPALTYTADALVNGEIFTGDISRATGETAGNYAITQSTLALNSNYTLNYTGANLSIGKRAISIQAYDPEVQYGNADVSIGYGYGGTLVPGDQLTGLLGREAGAAVGTYAVTLNTVTVTNSNSYDLTLYSSGYKIVPREVIVSGESTLKIYGDADPVIDYTIYSGSLLAGTQIIGALSRDAGENAGPYNVIQNTLAINDSNYKLTFQGGYFEIDRAPLTLTIDNKTKVSTKPNPALTFSVGGYKNGDTESTAFTSPIQLVTDAIISSPAGDYNIYVNGGAYATNYNITSAGGTLTVTPASAINTLAGITIDNSVFGTAFDPATNFYQVAIPNGSTSATITATVTDPLSSIRIGQNPLTAIPVASGTPFNFTIPAGGGDQLAMHVTAEDGTINSYYFNIAPVPSDSKLSNLVASIGVISPSFSPNVTSYTLNVSAETDSVTITPTTHDPLATARVSGGEGGATGAKKVAVREGGNPMNIIVRSADHTSNTFYQLYVKRPIRLTNLTLSTGVLVPAFNPNITSYVAKISTLIPSITITPQGKETYYQLQVDGVNIYNGDASAPITVNPDGSTTVSVKITAGDGETSKIYTINLQHVVVDASLAGLTLSAGTLSPAFASGTISYTATVTDATATIKFTPTATDPTSAIKVNGVTVASGAASANIPLMTGPNAITTVLTSADGTLTKTYTVNVLRAVSLSSNAYLSTLQVIGGTGIVTTTGTANENFISNVSTGTTTVNIKPTGGNLGATINVNGEAVLSGSASGAITLTGNSTLINVLVTAENGTTVRSYSVTVQKALSSNAYLSTLQVIGGTGVVTTTGAANENYRSTVDVSATTVSIKPIVQQSGAIVTVNGTAVLSGSASGAITLTGSSTLINVLVTAENVTTTRSYSVTVQKALSSNAYLSTLQVIGGTGVVTTTGTANENFLSNVSISTTAVSIKPTAVQAGAIISVNGVTVPSGTASGLINLTGNSTLINVLVTAENGTAIHSYSVTVQKALSSNAYLSTIQVIGGTGVVTTTGTANENYRSIVDLNATTVSIKPTAVQSSATITVNGVAVPSGSASGAITLTGSLTLINVLVTAENGTTTRSYSVTVQKALSSNAYLSTLQVIGGTGIVTTTGVADENFLSDVRLNTTTVSIKPIAVQSGATITVNGVTVPSGTASGLINLTGNSTLINVLVTAENGTTIRSYSVTVQKALSSNAYLTSLLVAGTTGTYITGPADENYSWTVNTETVTIMPTVHPGATVKVNGVSVVSGSLSEPITLTGNTTLINVIVTAENGTTTRSYLMSVNKNIVVVTSFTKPIIAKLRDTPVEKAPDLLELVVHPGVSPNGDGVNDHFVIDGLNQYTTNKVSVMNAAGALVYQTSNYGQNGNVFDGHANKNGTTLQRPGTYYYQLEYKTDEGTKRKSGYLVIKY